MEFEQKDLSAMLETAVVAARLGGQRAMEEISYVKTSIKNGSELVTQADLRCQQIIVSRIKENYPDHGFIGEENADAGIFKQPPRGATPVWWVIDPIDGTTNFAHQMPIFTISVAAMFAGRPIVGVVFDPATESMYTAVIDGEAQLNGRHITTGEEEINKLACMGLDSHYDKGVPPWTCDLMQRTRFRNLGTTALQFVYVAKGCLIATIANRPKIWDIAAGALVAERAGAIVSDWKGGPIFPVELDGYKGQDFKIMAANKKVHHELVKLIG